MKTLKTVGTVRVPHQWYVIDAAGQTLGRMSTQIATLLRGKNKVAYAPHSDVGDHVVIINASQVTLTKDTDTKIYHWHTGFPGGIKQQNMTQMLQKKPTEVIRKAVKGMLPKGPLGNTMLSRLKVYPGATHPHDAQQPSELKMGEK